jgi:hypothetical protein
MRGRSISPVYLMGLMLIPGALRPARFLASCSQYPGLNRAAADTQRIDDYLPAFSKGIRGHALREAVSFSSHLSAGARAVWRWQSSGQQTFAHQGRLNQGRLTLPAPFRGFGKSSGCV